MPEEDNKILKNNHGEKYVKHPLVIFAALECLLKTMSTCHNNPEKSPLTKCLMFLIQCLDIVMEAKTVWKDFARI